MQARVSSCEKLRSFSRALEHLKNHAGEASSFHSAAISGIPALTATPTTPAAPHDWTSVSAWPCKRWASASRQRFRGSSQKGEISGRTPRSESTHTYCPHKACNIRSPLVCQKSFGHAEQRLGAHVERALHFFRPSSAWAPMPPWNPEPQTLNPKP